MLVCSILHLISEFAILKFPILTVPTHLPKIY